MTDTSHARFSPSGAHRWLTCAGSMVLEAQYPDSYSAYAAEGTMAHLVASLCLEDESDPHDHVGKSFEIEGRSFTLTKEMAGYVADYMALVWKYQGEGTLLVERRVDFSPAIGQPDSFGTADAIVVHPGKLIVIDLKYGMGVKVDAEMNPQHMLYALGALNDYGMLDDFTDVVLVVSQPRLDHVSEWTISVADLEAWGETAKQDALVVLDAFKVNARPDGDIGPYLNPTEHGCKFCRAKSGCPALLNAVEPYVAGAASEDEFKAFLTEAEPDTLAELMDKANMAEMLIKAVRAEVERRLFSNLPVRGWKLVQGRKGNREWTDALKVEETLKKSFRLKNEDMYDLKLISPTKAEKLLKDQPGRWKRVEALISRSDGKPSVAPETDKRPAIVPPDIEGEFATLLEGETE